MSSSSSPSAYHKVNDSTSRELLAGGELHSLVLDGTVIYPFLPPSRVLYELSSPPITASSQVYGISKVCHRLCGPSSDDTISSRLCHTYDFKDAVTASEQRSVLEIIGKRPKHAATRTYDEIKAHQGIGGWGSCSVDGHFKAEYGLAARLRHNNQLAWKDQSGRLVAVETKAVRKGDGSVGGLPRLDLKTVLDEKDLDLLVACWAARVWKQAARELKAPVACDDGTFSTWVSTANVLTERCSTLQ